MLCSPARAQESLPSSVKPASQSHPVQASTPKRGHTPGSGVHPGGCESAAPAPCDPLSRGRESGAASAPLSPPSTSVASFGFESAFRPKVSCIEKASPRASIVASVPGAPLSVTMVLLISLEVTQPSAPLDAMKKTEERNHMPRDYIDTASKGTPRSRLCRVRTRHARGTRGGCLGSGARLG